MQHTAAGLAPATCGPQNGWQQNQAGVKSIKSKIGGTVQYPQFCSCYEVPLVAVNSWLYVVCTALYPSSHWAGDTPCPGHAEILGKGVTKFFGT